jgi:hypothetical protein
MLATYSYHSFAFKTLQSIEPYMTTLFETLTNLQLQSEVSGTAARPHAYWCVSLFRFVMYSHLLPKPSLWMCLTVQGEYEMQRVQLDEFERFVVDDYDADVNNLQFNLPPPYVHSLFYVLLFFFALCLEFFLRLFLISFASVPSVCLPYSSHDCCVYRPTNERRLSAFQKLKQMAGTSSCFWLCLPLPPSFFYRLHLVLPCLLTFFVSLLHSVTALLSKVFFSL